MRQTLLYLAVLIVLYVLWLAISALFLDVR